MQDRKPIAFSSRKLNLAQKRYTTTESPQELLSAIETWKEHKNIMLGYHESTIVFKDNKNKSNTFNGLKANTSDRVLRWLSHVEEYGATFEYFPGKKNIVGYALSHLETDILKIQDNKGGSIKNFHSGSENSSISNIKLATRMYTALVISS
jgi:hypothetical protein